jgi:hypothetical protein
MTNTPTPDNDCGQYAEDVSTPVWVAMDEISNIQASELTGDDQAEAIAEVAALCPEVVEQLRQAWLAAEDAADAAYEAAYIAAYETYSEAKGALDAQ